MALREKRVRPVEEGASEAERLQQVLRDLEGVERLLTMQLTLLRETRRRLIEVERSSLSAVKV